jgi:DNA-binding NarL/FixJ family response regulator
MIRVMVCDDSDLFREVLCQSMGRYDDLEIVASVGTVTEAIDEIARQHPDVALVDVRVGSESGVGVARWCAANQSECSVVMMTAYESDLALADSYAASALGFVLKDISCARLVGRVRDAAAGIRRISEEDARAAQRRLDERGVGRLNRLRISDRQIASFVARGMTDRMIAGVMGLSVQTIRNRVSRILNELGLENRVQLAVLVTRAGFPVESYSA